MWDVDADAWFSGGPVLLDFGGDLAGGTEAPSFVFAEGRVTIHNALDENGLEFGAPSVLFRPIPLR